MRCESCGRTIKNAELWRLATDPNAPTSHSLKQMCWTCRIQPTPAAPNATADNQHLPISILAEASEIVRQYEALYD